MKHWLEYETPKYDIIENHKKREKNYCNNIFVLDTESSSYYLIKNKGYEPFDKSKSPDWYAENCVGHLGFVYIWMLSVEDTVYYGRDLLELPMFLGLLHKDIGCNFIVYIHNLAYDYEFLRNVLRLSNVFARENGKPLSAYCSEYDVTFRDSLALVQMSLSKLGEAFGLENVKKCGDLDYTVARTPNTPLTEEELGYCEGDCLTLWEYLRKYELEKWKTVKKIPVTQTSKVRLLLKDEIYKNHKGKIQYALKDWRKNIARLHPDADTYMQLVECYAGGYTHANALYTGRILSDVRSSDFTSSYPAVMLYKKFPMSAWYGCDTPPEYWSKNYAYIGVFTFYNLKSRTCHHSLSYNKCANVENPRIDNGRMVSADVLTVNLCDPDFRIMQKVYKWDKVEIKHLKRSKLGYLPKPIATLIVSLFKQKIELKEKKKYNKEHGIKDTATDSLYIQIKQYINSIYGMCVTKYINSMGEWDEDLQNWVDHDVNKTDDTLFEECKKRADDLYGEEMLAYAWGVYTAAYARENLWDGIMQIGVDCVYCDTDSVKYLKNHNDYFESYNKKIAALREASAKHYGYDPAEVGDLGEWDMSDGDYSKFVTYGAKKYCVIDRESNMEITVAGLSKNGVTALNSINDFKPGKTWGYDVSGRLVRYENSEDADEVIIKDCNGSNYTCRSIQHGFVLMPTTYTLGIDKMYANYVSDVSAIPYIFGNLTKT